MVYSILAKDFQRKKRKTHKPITKEIHINTDKLNYTQMKREGGTLGAQPTRTFSACGIYMYIVSLEISGVMKEREEMGRGKYDKQ